MSFKVIKAEIRLASMIAWFGGIQKKITDFVVGSKVRTRFEAIAVEMEAQDLAFLRAAKKAIAVAIYSAFDYPLIAAVRASGNVTFSTAVAPVVDISIPKGTQVATILSTNAPEKTYETTAAATLLAGQTSVSVPVVCTAPGTFGNAGLGTVTVMKNTISGVDTVTNPSAFSNGKEKETEADRQIRFREYISSLARGTSAAIEYGAKTATVVDGNGNVVERVTDSLVTDTPTMTAGFSECHIYNGTGAASNDLIEKTTNIINGYINEAGAKVPGYKAAGIVCTVVGVQTLPLDVTAAISLRPGFDSSTTLGRVESAIDSYLGSLGIGEDLVRNELIERIMAVDGVYDVNLTDPAGNVVAQQIAEPVFAGTGADDLTVSGIYLGPGRRFFVVKVDGTGSPNTFTWSKDGGATWDSDAVAMTGAAQTLTEGVSIAFGGTTGHVLDDEWTFEANGAMVLVPGTVGVT